jgi:broad specificity phosphatase PhoE
MDKTVYFVRHAQSLDYAEGHFQAPDSPLSETGRKQCLRVAARLAKFPLQALLSSSYERARETAGAISDSTGLTPEYSDLFIERIKPPVVAGKPAADEQAREIWKKWSQDFYAPGARADGGENFEQFISRANAALACLQNRSESTFAVVTHGYFLRGLMSCAVLGGTLSVETYKRLQLFASVENTALTAMRYQTGPGEPCWRVLFYNDYTHLSEFPRRTG